MPTQTEQSNQNEGTEEVEIQAEHGEDEFYDPELASNNNQIVGSSGNNNNNNNGGNGGGRDIQIDLPNVDNVDDEPDAF